MMIVMQKSLKSNASKQWKMHNQPVEDAQSTSGLRGELGHERRGLRGEITLAS